MQFNLFDKSQISVFLYFPTSFRFDPKLLCYGLFQEKLAKIFSSEKYGKWILKNELEIKKIKPFSNITFHLTRNNNAPRLINIPHPISYYFLCKEITNNWDKISKHIGQVDDYTNRSMIIPKPNNLNNRLVSMLSYDRNKDEKFLMLDKSFQAKYFVNADIANCYPSIYSHSISWALVGISEAKTNKNNHEIWYNKLDATNRAVQRNETVGIPIGPDTSNVLSEIILSQIDKNLIEYNYFRFIDDYKCYCKSKEEADNFIKNLSKELEKFHLRLNQKKTQIIELPKTIEEDWVRELKAFSNKFLTHKEYSKKNINSISEFFDLSIKLSKKNPNDSAIRYAVKIISEKIFSDNDVYAFILMYLSRLCFIYPYFIDVFDDIIDKNPLNGKLKDLISKEINSIIKEHLEYSRSDVTLWGLHISMKNNLLIDNFEEYSNYLIEDRDCLPTLLCYFYSKKNKISVSKYFDLINDLKNESLEDEWWLYIYSLYFDSPNKTQFNNINNKKFYKDMLQNKITFY